MEGSFGWLWKNEELSDFTLIIRERAAGSSGPSDADAAADAAAGAAAGDAAAGAAAAGGDEAATGAQGGERMQTRAGKRRRVSAPAPSALPPADAAPAGGRSTRRRSAAPQLHQQQQQGGGGGEGVDERPLREERQGRTSHTQRHAAAAAAAGGGGAGADDALPAAGGRSTRRSSRHQRQQQQQESGEDEEQAAEQQQQEQAQQQAQEQEQEQQQQANRGGRRTRRSSASRGRQGGQQQDNPAAAAAGGEEEQSNDAGAGAAAAGGQLGPAAAGAAAAAAVASGTPAGRSTRSSRSKKRTSEAAAAAAAGGALPPVTRTRGMQQQQQQAANPEAQQQQRGSDPGGAPAARRSQRRQAAMQQLQHSMQLLTTASDAGGAGPSADAADPQQQAAAAAAGAGAADDALAAAAAVELRVPVHAVVLAGFSEYFKALICSWSGNLNKTLTLDVGPDEGSAALLMVEFMYTGQLPDATPEELLKMIRLADQYQVSRFMAAASHSFESLPLTTITQSVMLEVFRLPQLMLDAPEMSRVVSKARAKLLDVYGDLEKVWACETLREQFLALPFPAVRCLLASDATTVAAENTALVVLAGWVEEGPHGPRSSTDQLKELLGLIRLPYLTASFVGDVLHGVPWINDLLDSRQLLNAFQFAIASESTRQRLAAYDYGPSAATPHFRCPRPTSSITRCSFEWAFELSTVKRMVADAQLWGRVVELSSPLHFFGGFWWQLLFNVEKSPAPPPTSPEAAAAAAAQQPSVVEFVGVRCHVNCGSHDYWPRVVRFKATISALQVGFWEVGEYAYSKAIEGPIVDGVGLGYPGFFALPGQALDSDAAWSRFVRGGRVHLRCEVTDCE